MTAIEFEHISKQYRLGLVSTKTLSHDLNRWWQTSVLKREDPYLKIGEVNDRATKGDSEYVWALKDINFKVEQGDVVGIIGKNGAGKSTLLKLLSRVTAPTTGTIRARGRIASLLEVGTGFHLEMTGRENIYLNGAIMGMTKDEVTRKLDEIVDFSGCERYLDTPVKRYSSGMTVRLGFAVAAHLDPEILVVDEVLAVGDAEFQKKAISKMQDVAKGEGRTVLFVSHNMASIRQLCNSGVVLKNGMINFIGHCADAISFYKETYMPDFTRRIIDNASYQVSNLKLTELLINGSEYSQLTIQDENTPLEFIIRGVTESPLFLSLEVRIKDTNDIPLAVFIPNIDKDLKRYSGEFEIREKCMLPIGLVSGTYYMSLSIVHPNVQGYVDLENAVSLTYQGVSESKGYNYNRGLGWLILK